MTDDPLRRRFRAVQLAADRRPLPTPERRSVALTRWRGRYSFALAAASVAAVTVGVLVFNQSVDVELQTPAASRPVPQSSTTAGRPTMSPSASVALSPAPTSSGSVDPAAPSSPAGSGVAAPDLASLAEQADLALDAVASQSSTGSGGTADRAVDGDVSTEPGSASTAITQVEAEPYWQVDLGQVRDLGGLSLWMPPPAQGGALNRVHVLISDQPFTSPGLTEATSDPTVWDRVVDRSAGPVTNVMANRTGRYLRIQLAGTGSLALAEVQVWQPLMTNVARGRSATQSSLYYGGLAGLAVDGNTRGDQTSHTQKDAQAWWQVDLGRSTSIGTITVWNRTDCCAERLTDFHVLVSDVPFEGSGPAAARSTPGVLDVRVTGQGGLPSNVAVNRSGRYVRVQLSGTDYLSLAEVQVWSPLRPDLARGAATSVSSSSEADGWSSTSLTDGVRGPIGWSSAGSPDVDHSEWVRVDLGRSKALGSVVLYPRSDKDGGGNGFPLGFEVRLSDDGRTWTVVTSLSGYRPRDAMPETFYFPPTSARYVEIHASSLRPNPFDANRYRFQLAEVEAYAPVARDR